MRILLISYDLSEQAKNDIAVLSETIKTAPYWWHYLEDTWIIKTDQSPKEWYEKITANKFKNEYFFIIEISLNSYWGWLPNDAWEWLKKA